MNEFYYSKMKLLKRLTCYSQLSIKLPKYLELLDIELIQSKQINLSTSNIKKLYIERCVDSIIILPNKLHRLMLYTPRCKIPNLKNIQLDQFYGTKDIEPIISQLPISLTCIYIKCYEDTNNYISKLPHLKIKR